MSDGSADHPYDNYADPEQASSSEDNEDDQGDLDEEDEDDYGSSLNSPAPQRSTRAMPAKKPSGRMAAATKLNKGKEKANVGLKVAGLGWHTATDPQSHIGSPRSAAHSEATHSPNTARTRR